MNWIEKRQKAALKLNQDNMHLYRAVRLILKPIFMLLFRPLISGQENIPKEGAAVVTANHRSFWDSAFQALATERPIRWMGKSELFRNPLLGRLFVHLGAFPVERGKGDQGAIHTAAMLLDRGELVALFPEGTRVREGLGEPKKGAARLALDKGVATIPMSIVGTERGELRRALWRKDARVHIIVHSPVQAEIQSQDGQEAAGWLMKEKVWPIIKSGVDRLEGNRKKALALGVGATLIGGASWWLRRKR